MNRKKLPKAVLWTADAMREAGANSDQSSRIQHSADSAAGAPDNIVELTPKTEAGLVGGVKLPPSTLSDAELAKRRLRARAIVERHANMSAVGGIIPLPILNIASITAIIVRMVRSLSRLYGMPFERTRTRAIVIGLMGGVMPTGLATAAASTLIYFIPGYNLLGLAVSSVTASACARGIGQMFIEHFENGSTLVDFPSAVLR